LEFFPAVAVSENFFHAVAPILENNLISSVGNRGNGITVQNRTAPAFWEIMSIIGIIWNRDKGFARRNRRGKCRAGPAERLRRHR
jgi:hypothetical protein